MSTEAYEMEVRILLAAPVGTSREDLEDRAIQVLEAVEGDAADVAIDPVVSADFEDRTIALRFQVRVVNPAELPLRMSSVIDALSSVPLSLASLNADRTDDAEGRTLEPA